MSDRETMPPVDSTPPLTAERLAYIAKHFETCGTEWTLTRVLGLEILVAHAALTAQLAQRTAERDALTAQREEIARLGFVTGYVRAEGERQFRETGDTPFPAERDAYELRAVGAWEVLRELPAGARPPVFDLLAAPTEG